MFFKLKIMLLDYSENKGKNKLSHIKGNNEIQRCKSILKLL